MEVQWYSPGHVPQFDGFGCTARQWCAALTIDSFPADQNTCQHGSMTASTRNGFGQIMFQPDSAKCHVQPYAFHPMYDTAVPCGNTWAAHANNLAFADEIGHFEYLRCHRRRGRRLHRPGPAGWDGTSSQRDWPGTLEPEDGSPSCTSRRS